MNIVQFLVGSDNFPIYRTVSSDESDMLRALLGEKFCFGLEEGDPMDEFLFSVLSQVAINSSCFLSPPPKANLIGTFKLRDGKIPAIERNGSRRTTKNANGYWEGGWTH